MLNYFLFYFYRTEYMFNFNKRFQIHDDIDILKRMGLLFGMYEDTVNTTIIRCFEIDKYLYIQLLLSFCRFR